MMSNGAQLFIRRCPMCGRSNSVARESCKSCRRPLSAMDCAVHSAPMRPPSAPPGVTGAPKPTTRRYGGALGVFIYVVALTVLTVVGYIVETGC